MLLGQSACTDKSKLRARSNIFYNIMICMDIFSLTGVNVGNST